MVPFSLRELGVSPGKHSGVMNTLEARWPRGARHGGWPPALPPAVLAPGSPTAASGKKQAAKSKEELAQEKKKELERRLQDVSGQLSGSKKPAKKGSRRQALPLRGAGSPAAALLLGQRWEGPGGRWVADPALSLWLHCVTSHVSVHEALDLLGPHFLACTWG